MVQYSQNRVDSIHDLQTRYFIESDFENKQWIFRFRLSNFGQHVGVRILDLYFLRAGKDKREVRLTPMLVFLQKVFWKVRQTNGS